MSGKSYGLFCPVSKACEVLEPRWTMQILAEMAGGASRFNDIRRGIPRISPSLLSKRLKEMERNGLIDRVFDPAKETVDYVRTAKGTELYPILFALGQWAQRNIEPDVALCDRDARTLMWFVRRKIKTEELPQRRTVIRFHFIDAPDGEQTYWLVSKPGYAVELCLSDPGFDVDLYVESEIPILTGAMMGRCSLFEEIDRERIRLIGAPILHRTISKWLTLSRYAATPGIRKVPEKQAHAKASTGA